MAVFREKNGVGKPDGRQHGRNSKSRRSSAVAAETFRYIPNLPELPLAGSTASPMRKKCAPSRLCETAVSAKGGAGDRTS